MGHNNPTCFLIILSLIVDIVVITKVIVFLLLFDFFIMIVGYFYQDSIFTKPFVLLIIVKLLQLLCDHYWCW